MTPFASNPQVQAEIEKLCGLLRALSVDTVLTYADASVAIDRDVQGQARYSLIRARDTVEKEDGIRFATVHNVGIKRLSASEVPAIGQHGIKHINRTAKRVVKRLGNLKSYNDMTGDDRLRVAAMRMVASHVAERTSRAAVKEVESSVKQAGSAIDFGTVLRKD